MEVNVRKILVVLVLSLWSISFAKCQEINRAPHFIPNSGDMARFSLSENTPVGSPVYQLKGIDPEGGKIKYSISGPVFNVDRDTGVIRLKQELDREQQDLIEVVISITDEAFGVSEPNTVSLRREIPVRDFNDNPPTFIGRPYSAKVLESMFPGNVIKINPEIVVIDRDEGINADINLSCFTDISKENDNTCDFFDVSSVKNADGNYSAKITLIKSLDFENKSSYILTVLAKDGSPTNSLSTYATVAINVIDIQDQPPVFDNAPYSTTLFENTESGTSVMKISAHDGDTGNPHSIMFSLEKEKFGYFILKQIGNGMAELYTSEISLDRENQEILENGGVYTFMIKATELLDDNSFGDSATSQITIVLMDVDDHKPEFNKKNFTTKIPENLEMDTPLPGLSIIINDRDMANNSRYNLSIKNDWNSEGVFAVFPQYGEGRTPIVIKIKNPSKLDYDVDNTDLRIFKFYIIASVNNIEISETHITVQLEDSNDNAPIFPRLNYNLDVEENSIIGLKIDDISATDRDSDNFGKLKYFIKGFGSEYFYTNLDKGGVYVNKIIDYEEQKSFSLSLIAVDGGGKESNSNIYINVIDVNDNAPVFENQEYTRTIREGASIFEPQFYVRAKDIDGPTQGGGKVFYYIESENSISGHVFNVDSESGELRITNPVSSMDTEKGQYELKLIAQDFGIPPLQNSTKVIIRVGISSNQRPIFKGHYTGLVHGIVPGPPTYRVSIPENSLPGYNVTIVSATDPDGMDSFLRYRIVEASDNFLIDEKTGIITVSPHARLDRDLNEESYSIIVNAVDAGLPIPETATTTVYVKIEDVNDKPPRFEKTSYTAYVSERSPIGSEVITLKAIDTDLNANIKYYIVEPIHATSKSGFKLKSSVYDFKSAFTVDEFSGKILVNNKLDYNNFTSVTMTVEARDENAAINKSDQFDRVELVIYIQSHKETHPIFLNDGWNSIDQRIDIQIEEEHNLDDPILHLHALEPIEESAIHEFEIINSDPDGFFKIIRDNVYLNKRLDYETLKSNTLKFDVKAIYGHLSSIAHVNVTVKNINDNSPEFEKNIYKVTILESAKYPELLLAVKATDKDAILSEEDRLLGFNKIYYSLAGPNSNEFNIDNLTGDIFVGKRSKLDREKQSVLKLQVIAEDSSGNSVVSRKTSAEVIVDILDVNDNPPSFSQKQFTAVIPENCPIGTTIIMLNATDPDEGPGGEIKYDLLNEGEAEGLLMINSQTGEIKTKAPLTGRGRSEPYEITIRAQDNGSQIPKQQSLLTDVVVLIYIGDVSSNDGIPFFISPKIGQTANISENLPIGTPVFHIIASDPDNPMTPSGMLHYKIQDDNEDATTFKIEPLSGIITTMSSLDREVKDIYNIIVEVSDQGDPPQTSTRVLKINVLDVDDHEPHFIREIDSQPLNFSIDEEKPIGSIVANISAFDEDLEENGAIDYEIIDGNELGLFYINRTENNTAIIRTTEVLDREQYALFVLTVKCFKYNDRNYKSSRSQYNPSNLSELKIQIFINDIDDHLPKFEQSNPTIGIRYNVPIDTSLFTFLASDADSSAQKIRYDLLNVTYHPQFYRRENDFNKFKLESLFCLNNSTGEIRNVKLLSDFVDGYFQFAARANNTNDTRRYTDIIAKIFIIRDRSMLRFVFGKPAVEVNYIIQGFKDKIQQRLNNTGIELSIFDAQVLSKPDQSLDFTSTSSCFQLMKHGNAMNINEMKKIMYSEETKNLLREIYHEYSVNMIDLCSFGKGFTSSNYMMSSSGTWLVILAALIGFASLVSTLAACCLFKKSKLKLKSTVMKQRISNSDIYGSSGPVIYSEPIYGPL